MNERHTHTNLDNTRCSACGRVWRSASTLQQLGELTAQWLEGSLFWLPGYGAGVPDAETTSLVTYLTAINRAGLWTDNSQPGQRNDDGYSQRAVVSGFCSEETSNAVLAAVLDTELIALAAPVGVSFGSQIPVSRRAAQECTWTSGGYTHDPYDDFRGELSTKATWTLRLSWFVEVFDPQWGRDSLLWKVLVNGLQAPRQRELISYGNPHEAAPPGCRLVHL